MLCFKEEKVHVIQNACLKISIDCPLKNRSLVTKTKLYLDPDLYLVISHVSKS